MAWRISLVAVLLACGSVSGADESADSAVLENPATGQASIDTDGDNHGGEGAAGETESGPNALVLELAYQYEGGGYDNSWGGSGSPVELIHRGTTILKASENGTYCCGYTFAIGLLAAQERGLVEKRSAKQIKTLQKMWYGDYPDTTRENKIIRERQIQVGLKKFKIGKAIEPTDAIRGDFLQFWRTKSGHSVIFLEWIEEEGQRVGFLYRSSQGSTDGIGDKEERFKDHGGRVDPQRMYFARLNEGKTRPAE